MPEPVTIREEPTTAVDPNATEEQQIAQEDNVEIQGEEKLLAGKYKSQEELEKAYLELQRKQSQPPEQREEVAESQPQTAKEIYGDFIGGRFEEAGIDFGGMNDRWQQTGQLTEEDYTSLNEAGFNKDMVDAYLEGVQFKATQDSQLAAQQVLDIKQEFGGEKAYDDMITWAATALTDGEKAAFDRAIKTTDLDQIRLVIGGLQSRYQTQANIEPRLIGGKAARGPADKYESMAQVVAAMNDPLYKSDPAFRKKVESKLARSNVI